MQPRRILTWPIHGSYFNTLSRLDHEWLLPVKADGSDGYGGRGQAELPASVHDVPAESVRELDLDLVLFQSPRNLQDACDLLSPAQRRLPCIYLEHNTPSPDPVTSRLRLPKSKGSSSMSRATTGSCGTTGGRPPG
jgi:hypothetical protein